ncbi:MAG: glucose PTS transporter subunit IIA [Treponemataceae bacterium]|nr:glucose PTS transporter subunit IIA [Treponemataceae bacterium]
MKKKFTLINRSSRTFDILQKLGKSLLIPISVLPAAGLFLGIGSIFTNPTIIELFHMGSHLAEGTFLFGLLTILQGAGACIFDNLPLIFALGVAIGFAEKDKEVSALSAVLSYLIMVVTIHNMLKITGNLNPDGSVSIRILEGMLTKCLGITTLQMGVFGGVIAGIGTALLHNRFHNIKLPDYLSFFGGNRFVPIVSSLLFLFVGILMFFVWPPIQHAINFLGTLIAKSSYVGTFLYAFIRRLLIPFGLHHVFYTPFWYTSLGGMMEVGGQVYTGAQSILFAQLADPDTAHISTLVSRFFTGDYPVMMFGLPAAAVAMIHNSRPENKKKTSVFLVSALITSMVTGITEPIELPLLFASPLLYVFHAAFTGLANVVLQLLNCSVGCTFSNGVIDFILFGVLPGNAKTGWLAMLPVGLSYALIYYVMMDIAIKKLNLKTPGREDLSQPDQEFTSGDEQTNLIVEGLGGKENINEVDCCATRLRCSVKKEELVDKAKLEKSGAISVIVNGHGVQAVYGPVVGQIKVKVNDLLQGKVSSVHTDEAAQKPESEEKKNVQPEIQPSAAEKKVMAPLSGKIVKLENVPDPVFSAKLLGDGIAIDPDKNELCAPDDAKVVFLAPTKHSVGLELANGVKILVHLGLETVKLGGQGFEVMVKIGDQVKKGDLLIKMDMEYLRANAKSLVCPIICTDLAKEFHLLHTEKDQVKALEDSIFSIEEN